MIVAGEGVWDSRVAALEDRGRETLPDDWSTRLPVLDLLQGNGYELEFEFGMSRILIDTPREWSSLQEPHRRDISTAFSHPATPLMNPNPRIPTAVRAFFDADTQKAVRDTVQTGDPVASRGRLHRASLRGCVIGRRGRL